MRFANLVSVLALAVSAVSGLGPEAPTTFNGETVPLMPDIKGPDLKETIAHGNWLVEFFSPSCWHCQQMAPIWQKFYEFYYTLKPVVASSKSDSLNTFTRYYDFKFARLNCLAFGDTCMEMDKDIAFPTIMWIQDGKIMKKSVGTKTMPEISKWFEEILESIRPGSRPKDGPNLPDVSATVAPNQPSQTSYSGTSSVLLTKPRPTYNPKGLSTAFGAEKFMTTVAKSKEPWLVKFYAPWCHHCQAMAAAWSEMATSMKGKLNVAEVNCDVERKLCKDMGVQAFPTIYFMKNGEKVEYNGLRRLGDLLSYAQSAADVSAEIDDVNVDSFKKLEETHEVLFVYFYDEGTTAEDYAALDRVTLSLVGHGKLVKSRDLALAQQMRVTSKPTLVVSRDGVKSTYPYISPKDIRNYRQVLDWMQTVWQPLVPELMPSNAHELMEGSIIVLGVLSRTRQAQFNSAQAELKSAAKDWIEKESHLNKLELQELRDAKQLKIDEAKERGDSKAADHARNSKVKTNPKSRVQFAWVDGVFWEKWLKSTYNIDVNEGERVIIINEKKHLYWDATTGGNRIEPLRKVILETIPEILKKSPSIPAKSSASTVGSIYYGVKSTWQDHPILSCFLLVIFVIGSLMMYRRSYRRSWVNSSNYLFDGERGYGGYAGTSAGKVD